jgi:hypothetical protein
LTQRYGRKNKRDGENDKNPSHGTHSTMTQVAMSQIDAFASLMTELSAVKATVPADVG